MTCGTCHHNSSRFTFPIFAHSWRFSFFHSLQSITQRIYRVFQKELYNFTSPDLTPMDFFVWGFVKDQVFVPPLPANVVELRTRITAVVAKVTPDMLRSVWQETDYRWEVCRITNASHITIRGKTRCVLLHFDSSKPCPLYKFL